MKKEAFEHYEFRGSYREVGRQYGEALREPLREAYERSLEKALRTDGIPRDALRERIAAYYGLCEYFAPGQMEQLRGEGESSGIGALGAMLLNVSRELGAVYANRQNECTAFAVGGSYTADGRHYSGQNTDMRTGYDGCCSVVTFAVTGKPKIMSVLPIGCLAFNGMNSEGISCNRNFLFGSGWKFALPRYVITRMALECTSTDAVCRLMDGLTYPSSHHALYASRDGRIVSYELDSCGFARAETRDCFVHTNHFLIPEMRRFERRFGEQVKNSVTRLEQAKAMLDAAKGRVDAEYLKKLLSSHENGEDAICVHDRKGSSTVFSVINCLDDGVMLVSRGNPCENPYHAYRF